MFFRILGTLTISCHLRLSIPLKILQNIEGLPKLSLLSITFASVTKISINLANLIANYIFPSKYKEFYLRLYTDIEINKVFLLFKTTLVAEVFDFFYD